MAGRDFTVAVLRTGPHSATSLEAVLAKTFLPHKGKYLFHGLLNSPLRFNQQLLLHKWHLGVAFVGSAPAEEYSLILLPLMGISPRIAKLSPCRALCFLFKALHFD